MSTKKKTKRTKTKSDMWKLAFAASINGQFATVGTMESGDEADYTEFAAKIVRTAEKVADIADQRLG